MKVHAYRVAYAMRHRLKDAGVRIDAIDGRFVIRRHDDVAGRADVEVELAVRPQGEELPEVARRLIRVEVVDNHLRLRRIVEAVLDAVIARDATALGDEQRAVVEDQPVRRVEVLEQDLRLALAAFLDYREVLIYVLR